MDEDSISVVEALAAEVVRRSAAEDELATCKAEHARLLSETIALRALFCTQQAESTTDAPSTALEPPVLVRQALVLPELGRHYRSLRRARDLTQIELTVATGIGQQVISSLERRGVIPTRLRTLEELGRLIGADLKVVEETLIRSLPQLQAARHPITREVEERAGERSTASH